MGETQAHMLKRLVNGGGRILLVGGKITNYVPKAVNCPQIEIWDDELNGTDPENSKVPPNTKAILYSRWVSHGTAKRLRNAAQSMGIPIFSMLKTGEAKALLAEVMSTDTYEPEPEKTPVEIAAVVPEELGVVHVPSETGFLTKEDTMKKQGRGFLQEYVLKQTLDPKKTTAELGRHHFALLKKEGVKTTEASVTQAIGKHRRGQSDRPYRKVAEKESEAPSVSSSDPLLTAIDEAQRYLADTKAAISLLSDLLPKIRKEVQVYRDQRAKIQKLLG